MSNVENKPRRKAGKIFLIIFLIILAVIGYFVYDVFTNVSDTFTQIHEEVIPDRDIRREQDLPPVVLGETPFSVLILGIDHDFPGDPGRADTIMIATINPNLGSTYLLSIARDTMVDIPGFWTTRINHAHAYAGGGVAGVQLTIDTIQQFLNIPIDYYATLREDGFGDFIDAVGGVRVYNDTVAFSMNGHHFPLGYNDLTGDSALSFVRMRMQDPHGDFGRQQRQRAVIGSLINELAGVSVITRYQEVLEATGAHMRTDVTMSEAMTMSINYNRALRNITNLSLHAPGSIINGMYLIPIPEHQRLEMSQLLREHLELD